MCLLFRKSRRLFAVVRKDVIFQPKELVASLHKRLPGTFLATSPSGEPRHSAFGKWCHETSAGPDERGPGCLINFQHVPSEQWGGPCTYNQTFPSTSWEKGWWRCRHQSCMDIVPPDFTHLLETVGDGKIWCMLRGPCRALQSKSCHVLRCIPPLSSKPRTEMAGWMSRIKSLHIFTSWMKGITQTARFRQSPSEKVMD